MYKNSQYRDDDLVQWDVAVGTMGGLYFQHARRLGLPMPPACLVFVDKTKRNRFQNEIVDKYVTLLRCRQLEEERI